LSPWFIWRVVKQVSRTPAGAPHPRHAASRRTHGAQQRGQPAGGAGPAGARQSGYHQADLRHLRPRGASGCSSGPRSSLAGPS